MFWITTLVIVTGAILVKLGALSVLVAVQSVALKAALALFLVIVVIFVWHQFRG